MLKKFYIILIKLEEAIAKVLLLAIIMATFISAFCRYVFNSSWMWSLDLILLLFAWFAFFASSQAIRRRSIINVTIVTDRLPEKVRQIINVFNDVLMVAFMVVIICYTVHISILNWRQTITSMQISYSWVLLSLAVGGVLMTIGLLVQTYQHIMVALGKKTEADFVIYGNNGGGNLI